MNISAEKSVSMLIKEKAQELGFDLCGITHSRPLTEHEDVLKKWCHEGMNGDMRYLSQNIDKRIDPSLLMHDAKTVIVTGLNYYNSDRQGGNGIPVISSYVYGSDYHNVIKQRLDQILNYIMILIPDAEGRSFVDSSPLLEKAWAREAGLGWPGRHSILINNKIGSFFFIGIIILNIELEYDKRFDEDLCGKCTLCIETCPTGAINDNLTIDARKCIAYQTVENKNPIPEELSPFMEGRVFGCDKCQEVCPWNRDARSNGTPEFKISQELKLMTLEDWIYLPREKFNSLFKDSAILRRTYERFMRNVTFVTKSVSSLE